MAPQKPRPTQRSVKEVALDQLLMLLEHARECEVPECSDCARLEDALDAAEAVLLKPFR